MFYSWLVDKDAVAQGFPPPWSVEELKACFVVKDGAGQKLGYFYYEDQPSRRLATKLAHPRRGAADRGQGGEAAGVEAIAAPAHASGDPLPKNHSKWRQIALAESSNNNLQYYCGVVGSWRRLCAPMS